MKRRQHGSVLQVHAGWHLIASQVRWWVSKRPSQQCTAMQTHSTRRKKVARTKVECLLHMLNREPRNQL